MFLGIDLGTSEVKLLLLDGAGLHRRHGGRGVDAVGSQRTAVVRAGAGSTWWQATQGAVAKLRAAHPDEFAQPCAASACPDRCTAPCCSVTTTRCCARPSCGTTAAATAECAELEAAAPRLHDIAGNLAMPGFTAPKLLWVKQARARGLRAHCAACCCPRTGCACN